MATMNSLTDIWSVVMDSLSQELTQTAINTWFSDCTPIEINNNTLIVHTTSDFKRSIIQSRFEKTICAVLYDLFSCPFELVVLAGDDELLEYREKRPSSEEMPEMDGYTFDRFIVGPSNKFAHAAAIAVSQNPGKAYNPLLIYGNSGLGKTHLLLAIGQTIRHNNPSAKIAYVKGEEFVNQMVKSIGTGTAENFRQKYRNADLLLMDDIQFIAGKDSTQEEFFHTFNCLYEAGKQIVVTSDRPPKEMKRLDDRLCTRLEGGLLADVQPPDLETRTAIIRTKAAQFGMILSEDVVKYIAENITSNVRQLEGVVKRLLTATFSTIRSRSIPSSAPSGTSSAPAPTSPRQTSSLKSPRARSSSPAPTCAGRAATKRPPWPARSPCTSCATSRTSRSRRSARNSAAATTPPCSAPSARLRSCSSPIPRLLPPCATSPATSTRRTDFHIRLLF